MPLFRGVGVALVTPFDSDLRINYTEMANLVEYQIAGGTDAVIVCGTTGEPSTMTREEQLKLIRFVQEQVAQRVPVVAGCGGNDTKEVAEFARRLKETGIDGILSVTPYYNKATQKGLCVHYSAIAEAARLPMILYNVPSRTGMMLEPETAVFLGKEVKNIIAVKDAGGNLEQTRRLIDLGKGILDVYSGNDDAILDVLALGGAGVISVLANVAPRDIKDMVLAFWEGDHEEAIRLEQKYRELSVTLFLEPNPIPVKKALEFMGFQTKYLRLPLTELEEVHGRRLREIMDSIRIR